MGDGKMMVGKKPPKVGTSPKPSVTDKKDFRERNTRKVGMGGPKPSSAKKRLAGLMI